MRRLSKIGPYRVIFSVMTFSVKSRLKMWLAVWVGPEITRKSPNMEKEEMCLGVLHPRPCQHGWKEES